MLFPWIPDFQQLHLTVPAKAHTLKLDWNGLTINDYTHTIEVVSLPEEVGQQYRVDPLESYEAHRVAENTDIANNIIAPPGNLLIYLKNQDSYLASPGNRSYVLYTVKKVSGENMRGLHYQ
ncbi:hypothetical protein GCK72_026163 [Caenorhabditis remanei]|uniref:Uncharacterized protein n=1 Tax=Caenorhabditis remanei TaxID=31234 RepID=A0A6A5G4Q5_CAERE|nr:hypothetical protein GCK72_026163 [Caenorhabditis remanei]KAF1749695.1 hypothetical protein GCK72_026163 [Caenorhabditis remanei]